MIDENFEKMTIVEKLELLSEIIKRNTNTIDMLTNTNKILVASMDLYSHIELNKSAETTEKK